jgi:hypothetical protein
MLAPPVLIAFGLPLAIASTMELALGTGAEGWTEITRPLDRAGGLEGLMPRYYVKWFRQGVIRLQADGPKLLHQRLYVEHPSFSLSMASPSAWTRSSVVCRLRSGLEANRAQEDG